MQFVPSFDEERSFGEFRRKVRCSELLSASLEKLLSSLHFTGRVSIVVQNGRVLKSGYEEGYFRTHENQENRLSVSGVRRTCSGFITK